MDWASLGGLFLALLGIFGALLVEGAGIMSILQPAAFLMVVCGTVGAVLLQSRLSTFIRGVKMLRLIFRPPIDNEQRAVQDVLMWHMSVKKEGLLSLEKYLPLVKDAFLAKGLRMVVDGVEPIRIKDILDAEITHFEVYQWQAVRVWESAGGYSPTMGILGAVLGLIHVMEHLSDPSKLGSGIAVAFVATVYGVGFANLFFLPVAHKLKERVQREVQHKEWLTDILYGIAAGENSLVIEERVARYAKTKISSRPY